MHFRVGTREIGRLDGYILRYDFYGSDEICKDKKMLKVERPSV